MSGQRDEIEALLPAYAAGRLDDRTRDRVERALEDDPGLVEELRFVRALAAGVQGLGAEEPPGELGWHRLQRAVRAEHRPRGSRRAPPAWFGWRPALAAAAVLVIALQGGLLWQAYRQQTAAYGPLASEAPGTLQVRWNADATAAEIRALLRDEGLEIVAGPSASGVYRLRPVDAGPPAERERRVERLRGRSGVVEFVAPQP